MKRIIALLALMLFSLVGMNTAEAQELNRSKDRPEAIAKEQVAELTPTLGLNGEQQRTLFRVLVKNETSKKKGEEYDLDAEMKKALSPEQYKKWLSLKDN